MKYRKKPVVIEAVRHWNDTEKFESENYPCKPDIFDATYNREPAP